MRVFAMMCLGMFAAALSIAEAQHACPTLDFDENCTVQHGDGSVVLPAIDLPENGSVTINAPESELPEPPDPPDPPTGAGWAAIGDAFETIRYQDAELPGPPESVSIRGTLGVARERHKGYHAVNENHIAGNWFECNRDRCVAFSNSGDAPFHLRGNVFRGPIALSRASDPFEQVDLGGNRTINQ